MDSYQRRVQKLRDHVLRHSREDAKKEEKAIEEMTVDELRDVAKEKGFEGYSKLKKDELIALLKEIDLGEEGKEEVPPEEGEKYD